MNLKKISALAAGVALALGMASSAHAVSLIAGDLKFTFDAFDSGTIGYGGPPDPGFGVICTTAASCDTKGTLPSASAYGEDTWGVFSIAKIQRISTNTTIYLEGQGGEFLTGMFGGIVDYQVSRAPIPFGGGVQDQVLASGGWLKMFSNASQYNPLQGPGGRTGQYTYNGITGGTLALDAVFESGILAGSSATYKSEFNENSLNGGSGGFMNVIGGYLQSQIQENTMLDAEGNGHDLSFDATFKASGVQGWTVVASGQVLTNVPEPGSLAIFGLGLAGLAALRRRKQQ